MTDPMGFEIRRPAPGVEVRVRVAPRFRRARFTLFVEQRLDADLAPAGALLPRVLRRGTASYPETLALERVQAELYGADLGTGVMKVGERHVISVSLSLPAQRYVPEPDLYRRGLALLAEAAARPVREPQGTLRADYVRHEQGELIRQIRALRDNKRGYALWRCVAAMCAGEPYGVHELGSEEGVRRLDAAALTEHHRVLLERHPLTLYALGPFDDPDDVAGRLAALAAEWPRPAEAVALPPTGVDVAAPAEPRRLEERQDMAGGWLVLGFRTGVGRADPGYYPMLFLNSLLGGSVHSRLFLNVREKASLAYAASSAYDASKGLLLALAGIDPARSAEAERLILEQLEDLAAGRIGDDEFAATRATLIRQFKEREDRPADLIAANLVGRIDGRIDSLDEAVRRVEAVTPADVADAAQRLRLDTVYLLGGTA